MASSGIKLSPEAKEVCMKVSKKKQKCAILKLADDNKSIIVSHEEDIDETSESPYQDVVKKLPDKDVRYVAVNMELERNEGVKESPLTVMKWAPDAATIKKKMLCSSSFDAVKKEFGSSATILENSGEKSIDCVARKVAKTGKNLVKVDGKKVKYAENSGVWDLDEDES